MTTKPILFSAPMVQAIIDGRKKQTRRIFKPTTVLNDHPTVPAWDLSHGGNEYCFTDNQMRRFGLEILPIKVGNLLWVRENFRLRSMWDDVSPINCGYHNGVRAVGYPATMTEKSCARAGAGGRCRPSIHMPMWASRITLRVTDVRVQRLQGISEEDAIAEGIEPLKSGRGFYDPTASKGIVRLGHYCSTATSAFKCLWDSLNEKRGYGWDKNPWVAAYTFEVINKNVLEVENDS